MAGSVVTLKSSVRLHVDRYLRHDFCKNRALLHRAVHSQKSILLKISDIVYFGSLITKICRILSLCCFLLCCFTTVMYVQHRPELDLLIFLHTVTYRIKCSQFKSTHDLSIGHPAQTTKVSVSV